MREQEQEQGPTDGPPWHRPATIALLVAVLGAFLWPMFAVPGGIASGDAFRDNDWLNCRSFDVLARQAILEHGQLPLRSHLVGGGFPTVAHPSDGSWAPTMLAVLLLGDVLGVKVNLALLFLAGVFGVFGLARRWLELNRPASAAAALAFGLSAWAPSMLLSGFYHQAFFLLLPPALYFLLRARGQPHRLLWAGMLLCWVLQQGGHAFATSAVFLGVVVWLQAAWDAPGADPGRARWLGRAAPVAAGLLLCASLSVARGLRLPAHGWGAASLLMPAAAVGLLAAWAWRSEMMRAFWRRLLPGAGRLAAALGVALALGAARVVGLVHLGQAGEYKHGLTRMRYWFLTDGPADEAWIERFYEAPADLWRGLMDRVPATMSYGELAGRAGSNVEYEYAYLGLTAAPLLLAAAGLVMGRRRPAVGLLALCAALFSLVCAGWFVPPDFHFLVVWGLPWAGDVTQPMKYYNFFILLPLCLLAGAGVQALSGHGAMVGRAVGSWPARAAAGWMLVLLMVLPFVQNRGILGELFARPRPAPAREAFHQVAMVARASLVGAPRSKIHSQNQAARLRDFRRPGVATEYHNARRGVGTVDWYGTVMAVEEDAEPRHYITPAGKWLRNPRYRGEAWLQGGRGEVFSQKSTPNHVEVHVRLDAADTVVINQSYLDGFTASAGTLSHEPGLLRVALPAGEHHLRLTYRPTNLMAGLAASGLALLAWLAAQLWLWRRRKKSSKVRSGRLSSA